MSGADAQLILIRFAAAHVRHASIAEQCEVYEALAICSPNPAARSAAAQITLKLGELTTLQGEFPALLNG